MLLSLCGCSLNRIAGIFPQTSQITSVEKLKLSFFANNMFDEPGVAVIRASMACFEQIDAMLQKLRYFRSDSFFCCIFLADVFLFVYFLEGKLLHFWTENVFIYEELFEACFPLQCRKRHTVNP